MALVEFGFSGLALTEGLHGEVHRQGVHGFGTHTVEPDGLLKRLGIVLSTRIQERHGIHHLAQGDTPPIVAHTHFAVRHRHLNHLALAHTELVDRVVYRFLNQHIDAVVGVGTVAEFTDIHTGTAANMLAVVEVDDVVVVVSGRRLHRGVGGVGRVGNRCIVFLSHSVRVDNSPETVVYFFLPAKLPLFFGISKPNFSIKSRSSALPKSTQ